MSDPEERPSTIAQAFEPSTLRIAMEDILPLRSVTDTVQASVKYAQIAASIAEVGIIEPPVVRRDGKISRQFHLLDGHIRVHILKQNGVTEIVCLVATEDEAFTYNKRVSRLAMVQEHKMILNAIEKGVPEERLARALNVNIASIRAKRNLLVGICAEAAELLKDRLVPLNTFRQLKTMKAMRQIEAAMLMIAMNKFTVSYAKSLVAATPIDQLCAKKAKAVKGLSEDQVAMMEKESANLDEEFRAIERSYGADQLNLVLASGYIARLLENSKVVRYLAMHYPEIFSEFQSITELRKTA